MSTINTMEAYPPIELDPGDAGIQWIPGVGFRPVDMTEELPFYGALNCNQMTIGNQCVQGTCEGKIPMSTLPPEPETPFIFAPPIQHTSSGPYQTSSWWGGGSDWWDDICWSCWGDDDEDDDDDWDDDEDDDDDDYCHLFCEDEDDDPICFTECGPTPTGDPGGDVPAVPLPPSVLMLGIAIAALGVWFRR